ncbi:SEC-C motif-containing protein [Salsuginibacillus halophilus]|uniref:SEC-C motif-containing protein n=1 Tax=Salsuginibacillus halophilus TaxID=517424 RepID=A0A2P8HQH7_9BACI|nr:SEC-C metal-binding domain-containing protein [Salsuginibacillus halophilus]PSL48481.1 SEC-C motif-containing protein [Salsuginibacillus halophilus]
MPERNEPCPCGSGKKYKKCCARKESLAFDQQVINDIGMLFQEYTDMMAEQVDKDESTVSSFQQEMMRVEANGLEFEGNEGFFSLVFMLDHGFVKNQDKWQRFIDEEKKKFNRAKTKHALEPLKNPSVFLAEITGVNGDTALITEVTEQEKKPLYTLESWKETAKHPVGTRYIGLGVPFMDGLLALPAVFHAGASEDNNIERLSEKMRVLGFSEWSVFLNASILDRSIDILAPDNMLPRSSANYDFRAQDQQALTQLTDFFDQMLPPMLRWMGEEVEDRLAVFLGEEKPQMRKPAIYAAGAAAGAKEIFPLRAEKMEHGGFTIKELAEHFGCSPDSVSKAADRIIDNDPDSWDQLDEQASKFLAEQASRSMSGTPKISTNSGFYPAATEALMWKMQRLILRGELDPNHIDAFAGELFVPKTPEESQQLQVYDAYEAFEKVGEEEAAALCRPAEIMNVEEPVADLYNLKGLLAKDPEEKEAYFRQAVDIVEKELAEIPPEERPDNAWSDVTFRPYLRALINEAASFCDRQAFQEAIKQLAFMLKINPDDNQGLRFWLHALYICEGSWEKEKELLATYPDEEDNSIYWANQLLKAFLRKDQELVDEAMSELAEHNHELMDHMVLRKPKPEHPPLAVSAGEQSEVEYYAYIATGIWEDMFERLGSDLLTLLDTED